MTIWSINKKCKPIENKNFIPEPTKYQEQKNIDE